MRDHKAGSLFSFIIQYKSRVERVQTKGLHSRPLGGDASKRRRVVGNRQWKARKVVAWRSCTRRRGRMRLVLLLVLTDKGPNLHGVALNRIAPEMPYEAVDLASLPDCIAATPPELPWSITMLGPVEPPTNATSRLVSQNAAVIEALLLDDFVAVVKAGRHGGARAERPSEPRAWSSNIDGNEIRDESVSC